MMGAKYIGAGLGTNNSIKELNLSHNNIGDEGAKHIGAGLGTNNSIEIVYLRQ